MTTHATPPISTVRAALLFLLIFYPGSTLCNIHLVVDISLVEGEALANNIAEQFLIHVEVPGQATFEKPLNHLGELLIPLDGKLVSSIWCSPLVVQDFAIWPFLDKGTLPEKYVKMRLTKIAYIKQNVEDAIPHYISGISLEGLQEAYENASMLLEQAIDKSIGASISPAELLYQLRCTMLDYLAKGVGKSPKVEQMEHRMLREKLFHDLVNDAFKGDDSRVSVRAADSIHRCNQYMNWAFTTRSSQASSWYIKSVNDLSAYLDDAAKQTYNIWLDDLLDALANPQMQGWISSCEFPIGGEDLNAEGWKEIIDVVNRKVPREKMNLLKLEVFIDAISKCIKAITFRRNDAIAD
jgi:hypothetical protein